jgi:hypothetical protein
MNNNMNNNNEKYSYKLSQAEALKYKLRKDFKINSNRVYLTAKRNGWLNDICSHMETRISKPRGYWTFEKCREEALKYSSKKEFKENSQSSYLASIRNGWTDDICPHMIIKKATAKVKVYAIEFLSTREVYIGVSIDPYIRLANKIARNKDLQNSMSETGMSALDVKNAIQIIGEYDRNSIGDAEKEVMKAYKMLNFKVK